MASLLGSRLRTQLLGPKPKDCATQSFVITPSDTADVLTQGLLLAANGTVRVQLWHDAQPVDLFLVGGVVHPLAVKRVYETGTDIVAIVGFL